MRHKQELRAQGDQAPRRRAILAAVAFCALGISAPAPVEAEADALPLTLAQLVAEARERNPDLVMLRAEVAAARAAVPQAGALPDPMVMVNYMPAIGEIGPGFQMVDVMQPYPYPGKRGARQDQAEVAQAQAEHRVREAELQIAYQVTRAYHELGFLDRTIALLEGNRAILQQIERIATAQYEVGKGTQADVLRAQLEVTRLLDQLTDLRARRPGVVAMLNTLVGRPASAPVGLPATGPPAVGPAAWPDAPALLAAAASHRPLLRVWAEQVRWWDAQVRLAELDRKPDFQVGARAMTMRESGPTFLGLTFGLNVPLYSGRKQAQAVREARARREAAQAAYEGVRLRVEEEVTAALARLRGLDEQLNILQTGLLPQAQAGVQAALAAYQVGGVDFFTLMDRELDVIRLQIEQHRLWRDREQTHARLEAAVGVASDAWPKGATDGGSG